MVAILAPMNMVGFVFWDHEAGRIGFVLGLMGAAPGLIFIWLERGFSKILSLVHIPAWTIMVPWLAMIMLGENPAVGGTAFYAVALIAVNAVSLVFDYPAAWRWWKGDRLPAGRSA